MTEAKEHDNMEIPLQDEKKEIPLTDLPGIGPATAEKLKESGYSDMMSVAVASPGEIVESTGITEAVARKVINAARTSLDMGFETGIDLLNRRALVKKITTGSKSFDDMLDGGFETGAITECFGEFGSGKTQVGHILAVNAIKENPATTVFYVDTENTFRPERIKQLAEALDLDTELILKQIKVARAYNSDHQMLLIEKVTEMVKEGTDSSLVIVDSLTSHFRAEFVGRGTLAERQQKLNRHMRDLSKLAGMHNICVYVTNQVQADPAQFFGDPTKAVGGHIVAHASTFRIYLRKGKKGSRVAKLIDAPNLADAECNFIVKSEGLQDM